MNISTLPPNTPLCAIADAAHRQGCELVGKPDGIKMRRAIAHLNAAGQAVDAGIFNAALASLHSSRDAFEGAIDRAGLK